MTSPRQAAWLLLGTLLAAALAYVASRYGLTAPADAWLLRQLAGSASPIHIYAWPWLAALAASGFWLLRPRTGRRGRLAGWIWICTPCLLAIALWGAGGPWWPPLSTTLAIALVALLRRWRRRRFPELEPITALQSAADSALREGGALPCSLVRLQLRGPGTRKLPVPALVLALKARARRSGDRIARSGADGFVLWLAHTDAEAALAVACEIRADLAPLLARHDLRCGMGIATATAPGEALDALWSRATPPPADS